ncbi:contactin-2 isoform X2 [Phymastichus coffea]|uniref:contactin-2 isoform X2 n=1 Tax=Phymastichus coffea TaxID=108790 RepID=UPI00273BE173|nr:contactin-2 isoform X2 [Phymastichus coffea]
MSAALLLPPPPPLLLLPLLLLSVLLAGWQRALAAEPAAAARMAPKERSVSVDLQENVTLVCSVNGDGAHNLGEGSRVTWIREGREDGQSRRLTVHENGLLSLYNVSSFDSGSYYCTLDDQDAIRDKIRVHVRTPPPALKNVWVKPSTILANILWEVEGNGGYPIIDFTAEYGLKPAAGNRTDWKPIMPTHIPPNSRQIDVYHLEPNTTYRFRVWATNQLGRGDIVEVEGHTHFSDEEAELRKHLLAGFETFDTRVWVAAVGIVMGTLVVLGLGTCYLLYRECKVPCVSFRSILLKLSAAGGAGSD